MPFQCSSQRRTKRAGPLLRLSPRIFLPPSRIAFSVLLPVMRPSMRVRPPTASLIDMRLSLRITSRSGSSSMPPAWPSASQAMPAVIAPSPITATTFRPFPARAFAIAMPSAAEIEVEEWPTPKVSYSLSSRLGNGATPSFCFTLRMRSRRPVRILCG